MYSIIRDEKFNNRSDSIALLSALVGIALWALVPTFWLRTLIIALTAIGVFYLVLTSHWSRDLTVKTRLLLGLSLASLIIVSSITQLYPQWKAEHRGNNSVTHLNLRTLYDETPENYIRLAPNQTFSFTGPDGGVPLPSVASAMLIDRSSTYSAYFYIPAAPEERTFQVCLKLAEDLGGPWSALERALDENEKQGFGVDSPGTDRQRIKHPSFSRKVILFTEHQLNLSEKAEIESEFRKHDMFVDFRDVDSVEEALIDRAARSGR